MVKYSRVQTHQEGIRTGRATLFRFAKLAAHLLAYYIFFVKKKKNTNYNTFRDKIPFIASAARQHAAPSKAISTYKAAYGF